jgi:hypothetical protein
LWLAAKNTDQNALSDRISWQAPQWSDFETNIEQTIVYRSSGRRSDSLIGRGVGRRRYPRSYQDVANAIFRRTARSWTVKSGWISDFFVQAGELTAIIVL